MAVFEYEALSDKGKPSKGLIEADSIRLARQKIKTKGLFPVEVRETDKVLGGSFLENLRKAVPSSSNKVSLSQLSIATRQFSTLVSSSIPLVEALRLLVDQVDTVALKKVFSQIGDMVNEGSSLAAALKKFPRSFPPLYINLVESGEVSGNLGPVLERLADLLEGQSALKRKLIAATVYPILMLCLSFGVVVLLLAYVVPEITAIFSEQGKVLPLPTQIIISASNFVRGYWWIVLGMVIGLLIFYKKWSSTKEGRWKVDTYKLKMPVLGPILLKVAVGRMARTLSTLLSGGVQLLTSIGIVKNIVGNVVLEKALEDVYVGVKEGKNLSSELKKTGHFPTLLTHLIGIGEKTGELETMLSRVASAYESEIESIVAGVSSIIEPILILFLAVIVGGIMASVMLPMLEMSSLGGV